MNTPSRGSAVVAKSAPVLAARRPGTAGAFLPELPTGGTFHEARRVMGPMRRVLGLAASASMLPACGGTVVVGTEPAPAFRHPCAEQSSRELQAQPLTRGRLIGCTDAVVWTSDGAVVRRYDLVTGEARVILGTFGFRGVELVGDSLVVTHETLGVGLSVTGFSESGVRSWTRVAANGQMTCLWPVGEDRVLVCAEPRTSVTLLDVSTGEPVWQRDFGESGLWAVEDVILETTGGVEAWRIDSATGERAEPFQWTTPYPGGWETIHVGPRRASRFTSAGGRVVDGYTGRVEGMDGQGVLWTSDREGLVGYPPEGEPIHSCSGSWSPSVVDGHLVIRSPSEGSFGVLNDTGEWLMVRADAATSDVSFCGGRLLFTMAPHDCDEVQTYAAVLP